MKEYVVFSSKQRIIGHPYYTEEEAREYLDWLNGEHYEEMKEKSNWESMEAQRYRDNGDFYPTNNDRYMFAELEKLMPFTLCVREVTAWENVPEEGRKP